MAHKRKRWSVQRVPQLSVPQILAWADAYHRRIGLWPKTKSQLRIVGALGLTWRTVNSALRQGLRGLPGGSSLTRLLAEYRHVRHPLRLPRFSESQILAWVDAHHQRTGQWPKSKSGPVWGQPGETWMAVEQALIKGRRGLPGGSSLTGLLARRRSVRQRAGRGLLPLQLRHILAWADAHFSRTGKWPKVNSGAIPGSAGETWVAVDAALRLGTRGLAGGLSLPRLLAERRNVRNDKQLPRLTESQILAWADQHFQRTGHWPRKHSGTIPGSDGETWQVVQSALQNGRRGLRGGSTLPRLLGKFRGVRNPRGLPRLRIERILLWAHRHHKRTGHWPTAKSGAIEGSSESWLTVDKALRRGRRGLRGGSSLSRLLKRRLPQTR